MIRLSKIFSLLLVCTLSLTGFQAKPGDENLSSAKSTLKQIFILYNAGHNNLLNEHYPVKPDNKVSYLAGDDTVTGIRVAYLWPTSGVFSGVVALMETTGDKQYLKILEKKVIPGLNNYFDSQRNPPCYQSYITLTGRSDRYYDDNIWLAIDFCKLYKLTDNPAYLEKAVTLWQFVISGWDDNLGGGIYWCEQKKQSKNSCSNAPASVLALKLFEATSDSTWFKWGLRIYNWTKTNLQDPSDFLYFDNKNLSGRIDRKKYTYNTGQMMQAAALLYNLTGNNEYLEEVQHIAASAIDYFTEDFLTPEGKKIRLFKNTGNWFNAVLLRGYTELYRINNSDKYLNIFNDNLNYLRNHICDKNGLFSKDWKGEKEDQYKWLLDQAAMVEMWAVLVGESH
jgi:uncharacterized protein YyaL (SSP411 family)